jgi:cobalt-zinc-cadmium efflux system outer membrane protein
VSLIRWSSFLATALVASTAAPLCAAPAEPQPEDSLLASLVEEALAANPRVAAAAAAASASRARPVQVRSLPNPMLSVGYTNDGWAPTLGSREMTTLAIVASQELPYPGKLRLRGAIAENEARETEQAVARARLGIAAGVKRAYAGLLLARELLVLAHQKQEAWDQIEGVVRARYAVGQGTQQDVVRAQVEASRSGLLEIQQGADEQVRLAELNALLARPAAQPLNAEARLTLRPVAESLDAALERLAVLSPEVKAADLGLERGALGVDLARKSYKPDLSLQVGYANRGGLDPMWEASVGFSLPLYRKRLAGGLAEAEALRTTSLRAAEATRLLLRLRTEQRLAVLAATERTLSVYDERILPQDRLAVDAGLAGYQAARLPFVAVLDATTALYDDLAARLTLLASHAQVKASLEEASLEDKPSMPAAGPLGRAPGGSGTMEGGAQ